jgi:lysozyme
MTGAAPEMPALSRPGTVDGIDVSAVQGAIDWDKVAGAGFRFVFVKLSEGDNGLDPRRLEHLTGARAAGLQTGGYHVAHVGGDPIKQAQLLWDAMGDELPVRAALDLELAPRGTRREEIIAWALRFVDDAERAFGRAPALYTYPSFAASLEPIPSELARCPLWMASYASTTRPWAPPPGVGPKIPPPWTTWTLHQYSGNGGYRVPGVAGDCDRNLFNGDNDAFDAFFC